MSISKAPPGIRNALTEQVKQTAEKAAVAPAATDPPDPVKPPKVSADRFEVHAASPFGALTRVGGAGLGSALSDAKVEIAGFLRDGGSPERSLTSTARLLGSSQAGARTPALLSTAAKVESGNKAIDADMQEARERAEQARDAAFTNLVMSLVSAGLNVGASAAGFEGAGGGAGAAGESSATQIGTAATELAKFADELAAMLAKNGGAAPGLETRREALVSWLAKHGG